MKIFFIILILLLSSCKTKPSERQLIHSSNKATISNFHEQDSTVLHTGKQVFINRIRNGVVDSNMISSDDYILENSVSITETPVKK